MKFLFHILTILFCSSILAQQDLHSVLKKHNSVTFISVEELAMPKTKAVILDAREPKEYSVSHIKNAIHIGYNNFNITEVEKRITNKNTAIVVYCSLGIRSEHIANKLIKNGYTNVKNLYGGIFEWKNNDYQIVNLKNKETDSIHTFSKKWSKWLNNGIKVYAKNND